MMPSAADILARYSKKETEADSRGRLISVVNPRFSERIALRRFAETDDGLALTYMAAAAAVREVATDGKPPMILPFPKSLAEVNATMDLLDDEGMAAAMTATLRLRGDGVEEDKEAKNSQASPGSDSSQS